MTLPLDRRRIGEQPQPSRRFLGTSRRRGKCVALMLVGDERTPQTAKELRVKIKEVKAEDRDWTPERLALAALRRRRR